jgi:hypothetical protein
MFHESGDMAVCCNNLLDLFMKNLNIKLSEFDQDKLEALG